jgi:hypothetical protein
MTAPRLPVQLAAAGLAVVAVLVRDSSGLLSERAAVVLDDAARLSAGVFAAVGCGLGARRTTGVRRNWRRLMMLGMVGWSVGQVIWSYYQIFADTALPSPSGADIGSGVQVPGDVPGRDAGEAQQADREVADVLAHAGALLPRGIALVLTPVDPGS